MDAMVDGRHRGLLRVATAGSVDDGKSTLIGRLLYDSKAVLADQLAAVSVDGSVNLAQLTDGLRAEREQGITIDVAYRYFSTRRRKFVVADTPGHAQYTRNMVTGASRADLAIVLVDARNGVLEQTRRHAFISALLGVPHLLFAVNKMDLLGWDRDRFDLVEGQITELVARLGAVDVTVVPICALDGGNVVERTDRAPWYSGPTLLDCLERVPAASERDPGPSRLPVQLVLRPRDGRYQDYRAYAGTLTGGVLRRGDMITVLPSGMSSVVVGIDTGDGEVEEACAPMAVAVRLADNLDVSRGDMICRSDALPALTRDVRATVCWMDDVRPLTSSSRLLIKHTTRVAKVAVGRIHRRVDVNSFVDVPDPGKLELNDIGTVTLRSSVPLPIDPYRVNRTTGGFILVDEARNGTVAAGVILGPAD